MKYYLLLTLLTMQLVSCGHKSNDEVSHTPTPHPPEKEINAQLETVTSALDNLTAYEENEMKDSGLIFLKNFTITIDQTIATMTFDRTKISPKSSVDDLIAKMQNYITKAQDVLSIEKSKKVKIDETIKMDIGLKIDLCQKKILLLQDFKKSTNSIPQVSEMNKELNELMAFEARELRSIGLAFGTKEVYINGQYTKTIALEFIDPANSFPSRTYVEALSNYINLASHFVNKYKTASIDQLGNQQEIPTALLNELTIKIELSKNVIRELLD